MKNVFNDEELRYLKEMYEAIYSNEFTLHLSRFYKEFKVLSIHGREFISVKSRSQRSAAIIAHWPSLMGSIDTLGETHTKIGIIQYFIQHRVALETGNSIDTLLARVKWFENHPRRNHFHHSVIVCCTLFCADSSATFIPVARIMGPCTILKTRYQFDYGQDTVTIAIPSTALTL